jgi:hypothetical protein
MKKRNMATSSGPLASMLGFGNTIEIAECLWKTEEWKKRKLG